jgi:hypothetical protein
MTVKVESCRNKKKQESVGMGLDENGQKDEPMNVKARS